MSLFNSLVILCLTIFVTADSHMRLPSSYLHDNVDIVIDNNTTAPVAKPPMNKWVTGTATYYEGAQGSACGGTINPNSQSLVAVSKSWWSNDICSNVCVHVSYKGKSITMPVKDQCGSCASSHIDLSRFDFEKLDSLDVGVLNLKWQFVAC